MTEKDVTPHTVRIPTALSHCYKDMVGNAIYSLITSPNQIAELKELANDEEYSDKTKVNFELTSKFEEALTFVKDEYDLNVQQAFTCALLLKKDDSLYYEKKKTEKK